MLNLTPHAIVIQKPNGERITFEPSGKIARVETIETVIDEIDGVPIIARKFGNVIGLPEEGTLCLVSSLVIAAVPGRKGVFAPDTGATAIRNSDGQIIAVTRLISA